MSPNLALLPACPQSSIIVEQRDSGTAKRDVMIAVTTARIDGREVPDSDGKLSVRWECAIIHWQCDPLVPRSSALEVFVGSLGMNSERFRVGKRLDSDIEL